MLRRHGPRSRALVRRLVALGAAVSIVAALGGALEAPVAATSTYRVCLDPGRTLEADVRVVVTAQIRRHTIELREVDLNLDVAHAVRHELLARGVDVVMTWDGAAAGWPETGAPDEPPPPLFSADPGPHDPQGLEARGRRCVEAGTEVMFSIHHNGLPGPGNGLITLFRDPGSGQHDGDRAVAEVVHQTMWEQLHPGKAARGYVDFGLFFADWGVARGAVGIPAVILEPVVVTDAQGGLRRAQIARAEAAAILAAQLVVQEQRGSAG